MRPVLLLFSCWIFGLFAGPLAAEDASSGQIVVRGTVEPVCTLEVVDFARRLDLLHGEKGARVGVVRETCNRPEGYTLSFSSRAGGRLTGPGGAAVAYRISYDDLVGQALARNRAVDRSGPEWSREHELLVEVLGRDDLPAGDYSDVIVVEIVAR